MTVRIIVLIAAGLLLAACSDGVPAPPSPTETPSAPPTPKVTDSPTPTPSPGDILPEVLRGQEVIQLEAGEAVGIPTAIALMVETGCYGCDGYADGISRYYVNPKGEAQADFLLDPSALGIPPQTFDTPDGPKEYPPIITGIVMAPDASDIMASVCARQRCGAGGMTDWSPDSRTAIFRSADGGVTWSRLADIDSGASLEVWIAPGEAVGVRWEAPLEESYFTLRSSSQGTGSGFELNPLAPPPNGDWPVAVLDGQLLWLDPGADRLLRADGSSFIDVTGSGRVGYSALAEDEEGWLLQWEFDAFKDGSAYSHVRSFLSKLDAQGAIGSTVQYDQVARVGISIGGGRRIGNASFDPARFTDWNWFPSVFDLPARSVHPILEPFARRGYWGRNYVRAVQTGPFARVVNTGSCLNIRDAPSLDSNVPTCAADRVLLRDHGETAEADGVTWVRVTTPSGIGGWAAAAYLER